MPTVLDAPERTTRREPATQKVILHDISWETYERLLAEHGPHAGTRFTYDRGTLEIMSPLLRHERVNRLVADAFGAIADELGLDFEAAGSTTFRSADLGRGFEPDSCFYIAHAEMIREKDEIDLRYDPPPDLIIEVDITRPSLPRFPIFAAVGVPEVWRYDGARVRVFRLQGAEYVEQAESTILPGVTGEALTDLLERGKSMKRTAWLAAVRACAQRA